MNFLNSLQNIISEASSTIQAKIKRKKIRGHIDGVVGPRAEFIDPLRELKPASQLTVGLKGGHTHF